MRARAPIPTSVVAIAAASLLTTGCGGGSSTTVAATPHNGLVGYSRCMRFHGVPNFPDPTGSQGIPKDKIIPLAGSHQFQVAERACLHVMPAGGLGPQPTARQTRNRIAAGIAFARCLRAHGFPRFPDPTRSGQITPQMLANAGINLHQPAVLRTADACVGVTDGVLTKADVARAVNDSASDG